jgi:hypothetical protein
MVNPTKITEFELFSRVHAYVSERISPITCIDNIKIGKGNIYISYTDHRNKLATVVLSKTLIKDTKGCFTVSASNQGYKVFPKTNLEVEFLILFDRPFLCGCFQKLDKSTYISSIQALVKLHYKPFIYFFSDWLNLPIDYVAKWEKQKSKIYTGKNLNLDYLLFCIEAAFKACDYNKLIKLYGQLSVKGVNYMLLPKFSRLIQNALVILVYLDVPCTQPRTIQFILEFLGFKTKYDSAKGKVYLFKNDNYYPLQNLDSLKITGENVLELELNNLVS